MHTKHTNPIDNAKPRKTPTWRLIYERLEHIERGIESGLMTHTIFAESLGITSAAYSQAKSKAYSYVKKHGYFENGGV